MRAAEKNKNTTQHKCKAKMSKVGAWTIAILPMDVKKIFGKSGHVRVKGTIDGVAFNDSSLMPMQTGEHFLPIRSEVRKVIKKEAGSTIEIIFEQDFSETPVPEELLEAFEASPEAEKLFNSYSPSHKRNYIRYINESKNKDTRAKRAVKSVLTLEKIYFEEGIKEKKKKIKN